MQHYTRCPIQASGGSRPSDKWGKGVWSSRSGDKGGGAVSKNFFSAIRASVWSKNKGGPPLYPPLQAEAFLAFRSSISLHDTYMLTCYLHETISETCVPSFVQISTELLISAIGRVIHTIRHCRGIGNRTLGISHQSAQCPMSEVRFSMSVVRCLMSLVWCPMSEMMSYFTSAFFVRFFVRILF